MATGFIQLFFAMFASGSFATPLFVTMNLKKKYTGLQYLIFIIITLPLLSCVNDADEGIVETVRPLTANHRSFIATLYPVIHAENEDIHQKREEISKLRRRYRNVIRRGHQLEWLQETAARYRFTDDYFNEELSRSDYRQRIDSLLFHVDIIPDKLVMAQAAIETGWGQSRFVREANNYFGLRCFRPGCGIPAADVENPTFWVKSYPSVQASVKEYLWNLNIGHAYDDLRTIRHELRSTGKEPDALEMATALERYSEIGSDYIKLLISVIENYMPQDLEAFVEHHNQKTAAE